MLYDYMLLPYAYELLKVRSKNPNSLSPDNTKVLRLTSFWGTTGSL